MIYCTGLKDSFTASMRPTRPWLNVQGKSKQHCRLRASDCPNLLRTSVSIALAIQDEVERYRPRADDHAQRSEQPERAHTGSALVRRFADAATQSIKTLAATQQEKRPFGPTATSFGTPISGSRIIQTFSPLKKLPQLAVPGRRRCSQKLLSASTQSRWVDPACFNRAHAICRY